MALTKRKWARLVRFKSLVLCLLNDMSCFFAAVPYKLRLFTIFHLLLNYSRLVLFATNVRCLAWMKSSGDRKRGLVNVSSELAFTAGAQFSHIFRQDLFNTFGVNLTTVPKCRVERSFSCVHAASGGHSPCLHFAILRTASSHSWIEGIDAPLSFYVFRIGVFQWVRSWTLKSAN